MSSSQQQYLSRLRKDMQALRKDPIPGVRALPHPSNILEWHFVVDGQKGTPFEGGRYHGIIRFPPEYPFKPPSILVLTPNGRFQPGERLCLSNSDFHPESWNCLWSVSTIIHAFLAFMLENSHGIGAITTTDAQKREYAARSMHFNSQNKTFVELFPEVIDEWKESLARQGEATPAQQAPVQKNSGLHLLFKGPMKEITTGLFVILIAIVSICVMLMRGSR